MKATRILAICLVAAVSLTACGGSGGTSSKTSGTSSNDSSKYTGQLKTIAERGSITVITTNAVPFSYVDAGNNNVKGVARDLLDGFLKAQGLSNVTVKTTVLPFPDSIPAIQAHKADMILDGFYITPVREKIVKFTDPVITDPEAIVVKKGNPDNITTLASLCGKQVGVNEGTAYADLLEKTNKTCPDSSKMTIKFYKTFQGAIQDVTIGRVTAMLIDAVIPAYALKTKPDSGFQFVKNYEPVLEAKQGFIFPSDSTGVIPEFNKYLKKVDADGTMAKVLEKWGMSPASTFIPNNTK